MANAGGFTPDQLIRMFLQATMENQQHAHMTNQNISNLVQVIQAGEAGRQANQGYRQLKAKRDITNISASSCKILMLEMVQFDVDLGELGIYRLSEAAY